MIQILTIQIHDNHNDLDHLFYSQHCLIKSDVKRLTRPLEGNEDSHCAVQQVLLATLLRTVCKDRRRSSYRKAARNGGRDVMARLTWEGL